MPHQWGGASCLVAHFDKRGELLPPCKRCTYCHKWLRPEDMDKECPDRPFKPEMPIPDDIPASI